MRLITRKSNAANVVTQWKGQYDSSDKAEILEELKKLGSSPLPDDVDRITGNNSWTTVGECRECRTEVPALIEIGEEQDYESDTTFICKECLTEALTLLEAEGENSD